MAAQNATNRGDPRGLRIHTARRKPAWVGPLLTFMVRRGVSGSSPEEGFTDVIPSCLTAVSSGDDDAAGAGEGLPWPLAEETFLSPFYG
jgi:hypothetical protein